MSLRTHCFVLLVAVYAAHCKARDPFQHGVSSNIKSDDGDPLAAEMVVRVRAGEDPNPRAGHNLGPWDCGDDSEKCRLYKSQHTAEMLHLRRHNNSLFHNAFVEKGKEIEAAIDAALIAFRQDKKTITETIKILENPLFFQDSGYVAGLFPSAYELVGVATSDNWGQWWTQIYAGSRVNHPIYAEGKFTRPGAIKVKQPVIENGKSLGDPINYPVALGYIHTLAEEYYYASQYMQGKNKSLRGFTPNMLISNYYSKIDLGSLPSDHPAINGPGLMLEIDVYAKMLEVLGEKIHVEAMISAYSDRKMVVRDHIVESVEPAGP